MTANTSVTCTCIQPNKVTWFKHVSITAEKGKLKSLVFYEGTVVTATSDSEPQPTPPWSDLSWSVQPVSGARISRRTSSNLNWSNEGMPGWHSRTPGCMAAVLQDFGWERLQSVEIGQSRSRKENKQACHAARDQQWACRRRQYRQQSDSGTTSTLPSQFWAADKQPLSVCWSHLTHCQVFIHYVICQVQCTVLQHQLSVKSFH